jgi:hypothetical protein
LTQDEARITVAQTLGVVHSLVNNVKTVLEGARSCMICSQISFQTLSVRLKGVIG